MTFLICYNHPNFKTAPQADKYWNNKNTSLKITHKFLSVKFLILYAIIPFLMFGATNSYAEALSPLEQTKQGVPASEVACRENFVLMVRESGSAACLTPASYLRSVDRGWGVADLELMEKHPEQLDAIIAHIMQNRELREQIIEKISANPEAIEKIKSNEKLMNVLSGKGMVGTGQAGTQMGGMFGTTETGKQMGDMMSGLGFNMGGDSKIGNMIGGMVDSMMGNMESGGTMLGGMAEPPSKGSGNSLMAGMDDSPTMGSQMRSNGGLMEKLGLK